MGVLGVPYESNIDNAASTYSLDAALIAAIIAVESNFVATAVNNTGGDAALGGSYGLMQVSLSTAQGYGFSGTGADLLDPDTNLEYGCQYLTDCLAQSSGDIAGAASAYNSGTITNASGTYAQSVLAKYNTYEALENGGGAGAMSGLTPAVIAGLVIVGLGLAIALGSR